MWPRSIREAFHHLAQHVLERFTEISRSWLLRICTKRDMCVPLKLCGRNTYMLKVATVLLLPSLRSCTRTGWRISFDPDLVDRDAPGIGAALDVFDVGAAGRLGFCCGHVLLRAAPALKSTELLGLYPRHAGWKNTGKNCGGAAHYRRPSVNVPSVCVRGRKTAWNSACSA